MAVPVLVNAGGGTARAKGDALRGEVEAAFAAAGLAIELRLLDGCDMAAAAGELSDRPLVVVGGGDGTLGCAAQALVDGAGGNGSGPALGILPLGTRNHLALELGIPADLPEAAKVIATGCRRRIDLGRVGGEVFVNNASIGFYPQLVRERDGIGLPKKLASLPAAARALARMRHHRLRLRLAGSEQDIVTPMLFVGNNRYTLEAGHLGERAALDDGVLSVYAVASRRRLALIGFALRMLAGRADADRDFATLGEAETLTVSGRSGHIDIALDGEVRRMTMPLDFRVDAGALEVVVPA